MTPTELQMRVQLKKVNDLALQHTTELFQLYHMCEEFYGDETYNDHAEWDIIETIEEGKGEISFEDFDKIMCRLNNKLD